VCCGTKRVSEIACPPDCRYLASARSHPPAVVRRQQDVDFAFVGAMYEGLTESQRDLFWGLLALVGAYQSDPLLALTDADLAEAAGALAATYETAGRGLIYEHRPGSLVAQRLVTDLKAFFSEALEKRQGAAVSRMERDAAAVLRRIERGARNARTVTDAGPATALQIIGRVVRAMSAAASDGTTPEEPGGLVADPGPSLIVRP